MGIIYANANLKEKCRNPIRRKIYNIDVEKILKLLNKILGKKVTILEYFGNYDKHTMSLKVQTKEGLIENIEIMALPNELDNFFGNFDYLVAVRESDFDESVEKGITYRISKHEVKCITIDSYNKRSGITVKYTPIHPNIVSFVITKENVECSFTINADNDNIDEIISRLLELENLDLDTIYNLSNELNKSSILDVIIDLKTTNSEGVTSNGHQFVKRINNHPMS